jgi:poly-beta-hydroxyalkanoate depolymerase
MKYSICNHVVKQVCYCKLKMFQGPREREEVQDPLVVLVIRVHQGFLA